MHPPSRRQVLLFGAATTAALVAAWHGVGHLGAYPPLAFAPRALGDKTGAILRVLGDWLLPPGGPLPGSGGDLVTLQAIDAFLADLPEHHRMLMLAVPLLFEHGTALDRLGQDRLTALPAAEQQRVLDEWFEATDVVRCQLMTALRMFWNTSYLERTDVQLAMGIPLLCGRTA